ncbi:MAG: thiamine pyrophosphate-binding protein [Caldimonas sp.]
MTGADALVRMLQFNGVTHIFGLCGDTSLPYYDASPISVSACAWAASRSSSEPAFSASRAGARSSASAPCSTACCATTSAPPTARCATPAPTALSRASGRP